MNDLASAYRFAQRWFIGQVVVFFGVIPFLDMTPHSVTRVMMLSLSVPLFVLFFAVRQHLKDSK